MIANASTCLRTAVHSAYCASGYRDLQRIECRVDQGVVMLTGTVPSFFMKQMAQEIVLQMEPAGQVVNQICVS